MTFPDIQREKVRRSLCVYSPRKGHSQPRFTQFHCVCSPKESGGRFTSLGSERDYGGLDPRVFRNVWADRFYSSCFKDVGIYDSIALEPGRFWGSGLRPPEHVSGAEDHVELRALQLRRPLRHLRRLAETSLLQQELTWREEKGKLVLAADCWQTRTHLGPAQVALHSFAADNGRKGDLVLVISFSGITSPTRVLSSPISWLLPHTCSSASEPVKQNPELKEAAGPQNSRTLESAAEGGLDEIRERMHSSAFRKTDFIPPRVPEITSRSSAEVRRDLMFILCHGG